MKMRTLLLCAALASAACSISVPDQFSCPTPGEITGCGNGQICGPDKLCTTLVSCAATEKRCNGVCVDITHNRENCGDCATPTAANTHVCAPSEQCLPDTQGVPSCTPFCAAGQSACAQTTGGFICENLSNDRNNCGTCGNVCPQGKVCTPPSAGATGQCSTECTPGLSNCSGSCKDLTSDDASCGACGHACGTGEHCVNSTCSIICTPGQTECPAGSGNCVDTTKDRDNCGGCGVACASGQICNGSSCQVSCQAGQVNCNGKCIDPTTDRSFCGAKLDCAGANAGAACVAGEACLPQGAGGAGVCVLQCPNTPVLETACNGACVDLLTDRGNCGSCNSGTNPSACGAGEICTGGHCQVSCPSNLTSCSGQCVDKQNDPSNCGGCGNVCPGGEVCSSGGCTIQCPGSQVNCGGKCVDTSTDPNNCGGCVGSGGGVQCAAGVQCVGGGCNTSLSCPPGSLNCGNRCVDPQHDNANCGGCAGAGGTACTPGTSCQSGSCQPTCGAGLTACGTTCKDTQNDPQNCGAGAAGCGHACPAGQSCQSGVCGVVCPAGQVECPAGSGKCKDTQNDPQNCGTGPSACGNACNSGELCKGGACTPTCDASEELCGGSCSNPSFDPNNCGGCGVKCGPYDNGGEFCDSASCAVACGGPFANCDGLTANGCESNSLSDAAHCGGCPGGAVCGGGTPFCVNGGCAAAAAGVQQNVAMSAVIAAGWTQCFTETYAISGSPITAIQSACTGTQTMVACAAPGATTLSVAAAGPTATVFGGGSSGGVQFYASASQIGFAPASATVTLAPCDTAGGAADGYAAGFGSQRLCWPAASGALAAGARCGDVEGSGATTNYQRLVFTK